MGGIGSGRIPNQKKEGKNERTELMVFKVTPSEKLTIKANSLLSRKRMSQYIREIVFKNENLTLSVQNERLSEVLKEIESVKKKLDESREIINTLENEVKGILKDGGKR